MQRTAIDLPPDPPPGVTQFEPHTADFGTLSICYGDPDLYFNPFGSDPAASSTLLVGNATDYTEMQILKVAFGLTPAVPAHYYMGISTTPLYDNGTGLTELSGLGYARKQIPAWNAAVYPGGGVFAQPAAVVQFADPTAPWWPKTNTYGTTTVVYPFLADDPSAGNLLWVWNDKPVQPVPGKPLRFLPAIGFSNVDSGPWIGGFNVGVTNPPGADVPMLRGILNVLTGFGGYSPPTFTVFSPVGSALLGPMATPVIDVDGRAAITNLNNIYFPSPPATVFNAGFYQIRGSDGLVYWQFGGRHVYVRTIDTAVIPAGGLIFKAD